MEMNGLQPQKQASPNQVSMFMPDDNEWSLVFTKTNTGRDQQYCVTGENASGEAYYQSEAVTCYFAPRDSQGQFPVVNLPELKSLDVSFDLRNINYGANYSAYFRVKNIFIWAWQRKSGTLGDVYYATYGADGYKRTYGPTERHYEWQTYSIQYQQGQGLKVTRQGNVIIDNPDFFPNPDTTLDFEAFVNNKKVEVRNLQATWD